LDFIIIQLIQEQLYQMRSYAELHNLSLINRA